MFPRTTEIDCLFECRARVDLFLEEPFDFGYVVGDVYADGVVFYFGDADFVAIF